MNKQSANKRQVFTAYLARRGLSNTPERQAVLQQILASGSHFQADELYLKLARDKTRPVSRATVYRTLSLLTDCGLIRKVAFIDRHSHYEHVFGHEHLICRKCRRIFEFQDRSLSEALNQVCKGKGFQRLSHKIEVVGLCARCSSKKK
ncbi:MAG: transcriptional repressor [Actinobacteria bacterium]|nr:transcriptional repressor [Actinomycetota bacterium]